MTPKQILDSFSETLMQDERILSARERALLANLLRHAKAVSHDNLETQIAVSSAIASAVGETIAQRAFAVLGSSIVERIVEVEANSTGSETGSQLGCSASDGLVADESSARFQMAPSPGPTPPNAPHGPGPGPGVKRPPMKGPTPPNVSPPKGPGPGVERPPEPSRHKTMPQQAEAESRSGVSLLDKPSALPAQCVVLDEFLAPQELEELITYTLQHESDFEASEVISPADKGIVDYDHRRSRVLMQTERHEGVILERIKRVLPLVLGRLGMEEFPISDVEIQITASNNGDFFRAHQDNSQEEIASRYLTFVYFFHREPAQFDGGELRIHDACLEGDRYVDTGNYQTIVPQQNQIVFFPCSLLHEITPVKCRSGAFADSRFTLNGWLRR